MVGKVGVRNVESGCFLAGSRLGLAVFGVNCGTGWTGGEASTVGSVIRFWKLSRGVDGCR